jgi:hypothetical protein
VIIDVSKQRTAFIFRVNNPVINRDILEDLDPEYAYHVNRMRQWLYVRMYRYVWIYTSGSTKYRVSAANYYSMAVRHSFYTYLRNVGQRSIHMMQLSSLSLLVISHGGKTDNVQRKDKPVPQAVAPLTE